MAGIALDATYLGMYMLWHRPIKCYQAYSTTIENVIHPEIDYGFFVSALYYSCIVLETAAFRNQLFLYQGSIIIQFKPGRLTLFIHFTDSYAIILIDSPDIV